MIVRALLSLTTVLIGVCGQLAPPSWGMLTPSPWFQKANGTKNSITIPYDLTEAYKNLGLPTDYRVVYNYSFEYPNNPFLPPSTGYTYIYDSKGAKYEWWRPPRSEDGARPIASSDPKESQHRSGQPPSKMRKALSNSESSEDREWIPIGRDSKPAVQKIVSSAPLFGLSPMIYILGSADGAGEQRPADNQRLYRSLDGPVENKVDPQVDRRILDFWKRSQLSSNSIVQDRDFPPGFFAANRDDDRSFALFRRFAVDRDDEGFARFAAVKEDDGFARFAAVKDDEGFARFAAFRPSFASSNVDGHPLTMRNDLLWSRR
ncbi:hypothetical protein PMAYCL1PPCAC_19506 [Pristionchus mayeri]|uniref:Uncharacterized protein n=1 Tax=Pristionchus mayeri TaxID=1317129 RepID=A0AAN5CRC7_9BILA|nr:hypothetical protein PMAYCL1PPCAC_19506 [Pristionchus mayeri]